MVSDHIIVEDATIRELASTAIMDELVINPLGANRVFSRK